MKQTGVFKMPNEIITDNRLSFSAKRVAAVFHSRRSRLGGFRKSLAGIAQLAGLSVPTVAKALGELEQTGYLSRKRGYVYDHAQKRLVFSQSEYCCKLVVRNFTMVPRRLLACDLTPASFTVALFLFFQMGNRGRAFPSIKTIGEALSMGRATVCRALSAVKAQLLFVVQRCLRRDNSYSQNSYCRLNNTAGLGQSETVAVAVAAAAKTAPQQAVCPPEQADAGPLQRVAAGLQHQFKAVKTRLQALLKQGGSLIFCKLSRLR